MLTALPLGDMKLAPFTCEGTIDPSTHCSEYIFHANKGDFITALAFTESDGAPLTLTLHDTSPTDTDAYRQLTFANNLVTNTREVALDYVISHSGDFRIKITGNDYERHKLTLRRQDSTFVLGSGSDAAEMHELRISDSETIHLIATPLNPTLPVHHISILDGNKNKIADTSAISKDGTLTIDQFLLPGTYYVSTDDPNASGFACELSVTAAQPPGHSLTASDSLNQIARVGPHTVLAADLNGDHVKDLITASEFTSQLSLLFGNGDETFTDTYFVETGANPVAIAANDMNGDGTVDIIVAYDTSNSLSLHLGRGDGTFREGLTIETQEQGDNIPVQIATGDLNNDGTPDIIIAKKQRFFNSFNSVQQGSLIVLIGTGNSRFRTISPLIFNSIGTFSLGYLDSDRTLDLAIILPHGPSNTNHIGGQILLGKGDGTFRYADTFDEPRTDYICLGDINSDGATDIVGHAYLTGLFIILGDGRGGFKKPQHYLNILRSITSLNLADTNSDSCLDIVTTDTLSNSGGLNIFDFSLTQASIIEGNGDGTFGGTHSQVVTGYPTSSICADMNNDGKIDIVVATDNATSCLNILLGRGDNSFDTQPFWRSGDTESSMVLSDFNGDGILDVVSEALDGLLFLGHGDGSFDDGRNINTSGKCLVGDLNLDGRPDIVSTTGSLLGNGDGSFRSVGNKGLIVDNSTLQDIDGDGTLDILRFRYFEGLFSTVSELNVLYGTGDGTFSKPTTTTLDGATEIRTGDLDGDGLVDIITRFKDGRFKALLGTADIKTRFKTLVPAELPSDLVLIDLVDVDLDGLDDVVASRPGPPGVSSSILVAYGKGNGIFEVPIVAAIVSELSSTVTCDFNRDGLIDFVTNSTTNSAAIVLNRGSAGDRRERTFTTLVCDGLSTVIDSIAVGDLNGDGLSDLITLDRLHKNFFSSLQVGRRDNTSSQMSFATLTDLSFVNTFNATVYIPSKGFSDGTLTLSLDIEGQILVREPSRSIASRIGASFVDRIEKTPRAFDCVAIQSRIGSQSFGFVDSRRKAVFVVPTTSGGVHEDPYFVPIYSGVDGDSLTVLSRISSCDLNGDGFGDIVVSDPGEGIIHVLVADSRGHFYSNRWQSIGTATGVISIIISDVNRDGIPDLVSSNQVSGDVSIRYGIRGFFGTEKFTASDGFGAEFRFRTQTRPYGYGVDPFSLRGTAVAQSRLTDIALGDVTGDTLVDIVAVNAQAHSFAILAGLPGGGFSAPQEHLVRIPLTPGPVVARTSIEVQVATVGDFDGDGRADIAFLDRQGEQIVLYTTSDNPTFEQPGRLIPLKGNLPRSLLASDVGGPSGAPDGVLDLVIGNDYGDVLILQGQAGKAGRGNGLFETLVRTDKTVALLAADMDGDGKDDFVYGNKGLDRVTMDTTGTKEAFRADQASGIIGPSAVATVDETVAGRAIRNLVVANGGGNEILLFSRNLAAATGSPDLFLAPQRFFVGSNPSSLAVADVDADGLPDVVVANAGSNDLSVMLGSIGTDGRWTMKAGPRLAAGGSNPAGVALGDFVRADGSRGRDGTLDIAVTTPGSNSVNILAGRGGGFFNDRFPLPLVLPPDASPGPIVPLPGGIGIGNIGNATITIVDVTRSGATQEFFASRSYSSGGVGPSSLSTFSSGGTTYLGVGNASGSVSLFVGKAGSLDFTLDRAAQLPGVTGVAFESTGRLFGMGPGRQSALDLFGSSVAPAAAGTGGSGLAAISAAVLYLPLRSSAVALVATIISSGALGSGEGGPRTAPVATGRTGDRPVADGASGGEEEGDDEGKPPKDDTEAEAAEDPAIAALLKLFLDVETALRTNNRQLLDTLLDGEDGDRTPGAGSEAPAAPAAPAPAESEPPTALLKQLTDWWNLAFTGGGEGDDGDRSGAAAVEGDAPQPRLTVPSGPIPTASIPSAAWLWGGLFSVGETDQLSPAANRRRPLERDRPKRGGHRAPQLTSHRSPRRGK